MPRRLSVTLTPRGVTLRWDLDKEAARAKDVASDSHTEKQEPTDPRPVYGFRGNAEKRY